MTTRLTLAEALAGDRLEDFIVQAERDGVGPGAPPAFDYLVREASTERPPANQTSRSRGRGGSRGQ